MKKLFVFGALVAGTQGANAENVINGNPFYHPAQGRFYNILTPIQVNSKFDKFVMADKFGYGLTDDVAVYVATSGSYDSSNNPEFGKWAWNDLEVGFDWGLLHDDMGRIAELYGRGMQIYDTRHHLETIAYNWTLGARVGRVAKDWTLAAVVQVDYLKDDVSHYNHDAWAMTVGLQGQYLIDTSWNFTGELLFDYDLFEEYYNGERLELKLGLNYNLDADKYLGVYVSKDVVHSFNREPMLIGVNFGIDF